MKKLSIAWLYVFFTAALFGQTNNSKDDYVLDKDSIKLKDKILYGMQLGTSFGSFKNGNYFSTYYSPFISYRINNTWKILTGVNVQQYHLNDYPLFYSFDNSSYKPYSGNIHQYSAYAAALHKISGKLIVSGELFYNMMLSGNLNFNNNITALDRIGYAASFIYKVNDRMYIMGEFRSNNGGYFPFRHNGLDRGAFTHFNQPFGANPFLNW